MCTACDVCGWKSNEVKSGAAIRDHGCKLTVSIEKVSFDPSIFLKWWENIIGNPWHFFRFQQLVVLWENTLVWCKDQETREGVC